MLGKRRALFLTISKFMGLYGSSNRISGLIIIVGAFTKASNFKGTILLTELSVGSREEKDENH